METGSFAMVWTPEDTYWTPDLKENAYSSQTSTIKVYAAPESYTHVLKINHRGQVLEYRLADEMFIKANDTNQVFSSLFDEIKKSFPPEDSYVIHSLLKMVFSSTPAFSFPSNKILEKVFGLAAASTQKESDQIYKTYLPEPSLAQLSRNLPGVEEIVAHPTTGAMYPLRVIIMDLNDAKRWTREQIADWIETLDININFKLPEEEKV